jgi:starch-binding outer membrane protein, SusD/RagB family
MAVMSSCSKKLELEPKQSIDAATAIRTAQDLESAVIGGYSVLGSGALYGNNMNILPELLASSGYCTWLGTFSGPRQVSNKTMTSENSEASRTWITAYRGINVANTVLANLNVVTDVAKKNQLEGEALLMRGLLHFELVRFYALPWDPLTANSQLGVPVKIKQTTNEEEASAKPTRNTVAEVYTQVINDFTAAVNKLPEENGTRLTRYAAHAFLARVYLQQSNFAKARDEANIVIKSGFYELNAGLLAPFTNRNTKESVFEIQQNDQNNAGEANDGLATFYASLIGIGRGDIRIQGAFLSLYPAGDGRLSQWYYVGSGERPGNNNCGKWLTFSTNIPVVRLAEMYLIRAECNRRLGTNIGDTPENDLDQTRFRAGLPLLVAPTVNDILLERRLELAFEGFRIHDIRRLKGATGTFAWNAPKLVFPIPQREIDATNASLVQNPGY